MIVPPPLSNCRTSFITAAAMKLVSITIIPDLSITSVFRNRFWLCNKFSESVEYPEMQGIYTTPETPDCFSETPYDPERLLFQNVNRQLKTLQVSPYMQYRFTALSRRTPLFANMKISENPVPPQTNPRTCNQRQLWYSNFQNVDAIFSEENCPNRTGARQ